MTSLKRQLDLPYRPEDLFDLVAEVDRYPEFIKWIRALRLISQKDAPGSWRGRAEASVGFKGFTETFITDIEAQKSDLTIDVSLVRGPFRKLSNSWRFTAIATGSRIEFAIAFEFRNFILQTLADANRDYAVNRIIEAFSAEAGRRFEKIATPV